jgi:succinate dehydrogenase/fumarate reductase cytochrome b subunit
MKTLVALAFLGVILYNLGAGLYYMIADKGTSDRMVKALTRRIALSVALIVLVLLGIATGFVQPHGVVG